MNLVSRFFHLTILLLLGCPAAHAQDLDKAKAEFEASLKGMLAPLEELGAGYVGALKKVEEEARKEGNLDGMLLIREEVKNYAAGPVKDIAKFPELARTRAIYDKNRALRLGEIQQALGKRVGVYVAELDELVVSLTKLGKIDEGIAVKKEADRIRALNADPKLMASVLLKIDTSGAVAGAAEASEESSIPASAANIQRFIPLDQRPSGTLHLQGVALGDRAAQMLPDQREGIVEVRVSWNRWIALKKDGTVIGAPTAETQPPADMPPAVAIQITANCHVAFHADGTATCWGRFKTPADIPPKDLGPVRDIAAAETTGLAAMPDGSLKVWGSVYADDKAREAIESKIKDVVHVAAAGDIAWAATESGKVYRWRKEAPEPVVLGRVTGIKQLEATFAGIALLTDKGKVEGWSQWGGGLVDTIPSNLAPAKNIKASWSSLVIQKEDGTYFADGSKFPQLIELFAGFDDTVIDAAMGSWTTNGLVGWIKKAP